MGQIIDVFEFDSYKIQPDKKAIDFNYKAGELYFTEKIILPDEITSPVNDKLLNKVLESLHLILGISYYKMFCPKKITVPYSLTKEQASFWETVYTKGLGEFFYRNKIDFRGLINFPKTSARYHPAKREVSSPRFLVAIGGGKDSIVTVETLKEKKMPVTGYILQSQPTLPLVQKEIVETMGINYLVVKRELDKKLFELENKERVYKGHIPITAIYSFIGLLLSVIYDYSSIIVSNEKSASFGNLDYLGMEINHQWSKSLEFEKLFQDYIHRFISQDINYLSILRQYTELEIAEKFAQYKKYFPVFSSCNKNFKIVSPSQKRWCGDCPKCAFNFVILAAFIPKNQMIKIFGKNLLNDKNLVSLYKDLRGEGKMKPFDCVGTFEETKQAFELIAKKGEHSL